MSSPVCFDEGQTCDSLALRKAKRAINQRHYSAQVSKCVASMFFEDLAMYWTGRGARARQCASERASGAESAGYVHLIQDEQKYIKMIQLP